MRLLIGFLGCGYGGRGGRRGRREVEMLGSGKRGERERERREREMCNHGGMTVGQDIGCGRMKELRRMKIGR